MYLPRQALDDTENLIVAHVDEGVENAISFLERVVNINSGSMNFDGVREVGQVFDNELTALGFETEWLDGAAFQRAGHLFARRGTTGPSLSSDWPP